MRSHGASRALTGRSILPVIPGDLPYNMLFWYQTPDCHDISVLDVENVPSNGSYRRSDSDR